MADKSKYLAPEIEVVELASGNVVCTSGYDDNYVNIDSWS